jgi:hypothetical protein
MHLKSQDPLFLGGTCDSSAAHELGQLPFPKWDILPTKSKEHLARLKPESLWERRWLLQNSVDLETGALDEHQPGKQEALVLIPEVIMTPVH